MLKLALAALLLGAVSAVPLPKSPLSYCAATVTRDYTLGITYLAIINRADTCAARQVTRLRKVSTLNLGARYAPIKPLTGAWTVTTIGSSVPASELWTLYSWRWQWWDGAGWVFSEER
ncbi:hypothetical protein [Deinococcus altitudinis]|uniref:hypothetical protein n=1 Tax=Deinococcus altitudinis TaxID=468914 RepID=UPI0038912623